MKLLVKLHDIEAKVPTRAYKEDIGLDLFTLGDHEIPPHHFRDIPCGVSVVIPNGGWYFLMGRSSTIRKMGLLVATGLIDSGYTGELHAGCFNLTDRPVHVKHHVRLAQLVPFMSDIDYDIEVVDELPRSARGSNGYGSSGV